MAPVADQVRPEPADTPEPAPDPREVDVPGQLADRIGQLYAEEERQTRLARTESLIRAAEKLR